MYALNHWYAVAWDYEIGRRPLSRTVCDEAIVLYRKKDGGIVALADRCWHRMAPLSMGTVLDNDEIQCPYHGLVYDSEGKCTHMPSQDRIPKTACVKSYPVVLRHRFIWTWIGETEKADESLIPDLHWNDDPGWMGEGGTIFLKANYKLLIDNLMDLTHETYVHASSIGDQFLPSAPIETVADEDSVTVRRVVSDHQPAPFWKNAIRNALGTDENCDRWQIIRLTPPSTIAIDVGVAITGTGALEGDRSKGVCGYVLNAITPETESSTMYFWNFVRNFDLTNRSLTQETQKTIGGVFAEDVEMLESQQRAIQSMPEVRLANLNIDAGSVRARHLLDKLERKTNAAA